MSINRRAARRDSNERQIVEALEGMGAIVERLSKPLDLLVNVQGVIALADVKAPRTGRLTADQVAFLKKWDGAPIYLLRTVEDAERMVNELRAKA
jgi:hypothetical protein